MHTITIDFTEADSIDTASYQAFCNDCDWSGEHHHADTDSPEQAADEAHDDALQEGIDHQLDAQSL